MLDQISNSSNPPLHGKWLSHADEIFSDLEKGNSRKETWWQSMGSTLSLLRQAHQIIADADQKIKEQENHILKLRHLSTTDELTSVTNRRGILQAFERELDRVNRDVSQGGLFIMIDLDNFKVINDRYGHDAGDKALKLVAKTLNTDSRTMDVVGRMGGDEFVMLFVNTTRKAALERAQFLIKKLNNMSFIWKGEEVQLRASLGLREYGKNSTIKQIFSDADADMYSNKIGNKMKA
jgi:diguanylate cyclase (GGDEF)-like protein